MKKVLGFIGLAVYATLWAVLLYKIAYWITPWFMSQKIWVFVLFWVVFAYVIEMVVGFLMSILFGMPVVWLANSNAAKILPTIALMIMGYYACKLPWDYNIRYDTANIFKAVIMDCVYVFVFFNTILMVWTEADDASDV